jgi:hypothetical protein
MEDAMADPTNPFEISEEMRRLAEGGLEQARKAFNDYVDAAEKALTAFGGTRPGKQPDLPELNRQALAYMQENFQAGVDFLGRLASARSMEDGVNMLRDFLLHQAEAARRQVEELTHIFTAAIGTGRQHS